MKSFDLSVCPITGKKLSSDYISIIVNDKEVRVCCELCKQRVIDLIEYTKKDCPLSE